MTTTTTFYANSSSLRYALSTTITAITFDIVKIDNVEYETGGALYLRQKLPILLIIKYDQNLSVNYS